MRHVENTQWNVFDKEITETVLRQSLCLDNVPDTYFRFHTSERVNQTDWKKQPGGWRDERQKGLHTIAGLKHRSIWSSRRKSLCTHLWMCRMEKQTLNMIKNNEEADIHECLYEKRCPFTKDAGSSFNLYKTMRNKKQRAFPSWQLQDFALSLQHEPTAASSLLPMSFSCEFGKTWLTHWEESLQ